MGDSRTFNGDTGVLYRQAVRTPLPNKDAERVFHENMMRVADAQVMKAEMLEDPDISPIEGNERQLEQIEESYRTRLQHIAGDEYERIALEYYNGDREDTKGALAAYYLEGLWRMQQQRSITDMLFFPIILRYPECFTVNIRFSSGYTTTESVLYESPEHSEAELEEKYHEHYYNDCLYSQKEAAESIRDTAEIIREEFQDPDDVPFDERKYGGIVSGNGRRGSLFSTMLKRVEPDPDRFSDSIDEPTLVEEGPEAQRTEEELLTEDELLI